MSMLRSAMIAGASVAAGAVLARAIRDLACPYSFAGRVAAVMGGSRGLGLILSRQLGARGARVAIVARDEAELERAAEDLASRGVECVTIPADLRQKEQVLFAVQHAADRLGPVDILVNNAGVIQVGPIDHMTEDDFIESLAIHFFAPLHATLAVLPMMRARGSGRIVNISSIAGKLPTPHLAPYVAGKFALAGLSGALRAELAKEGIYITSVYPGLMRTGSHFNAQFKGRHRDEFTWFAALDAMPLLSMNANRAARRILDACRRGDPELTVGIPAKLAATFHALAPNTSARLQSLMNRLLPAASPEHGTELFSGWDSRSPRTPSRLTRLADRATAANNELRGHAPPA